MTRYLRALLPPVDWLATLAGLPPQVGVYGYILGGLGYALLGSSRHLASGPTSAISLMVAASVGTMAGGDAARYAEIASLAAFAIAILCVIAWALRLSESPRRRRRRNGVSALASVWCDRMAARPIFVTRSSGCCGRLGVTYAIEPTRPWPAIMPSSSSISTGLVKPNSRIEAAVCANPRRACIPPRGVAALRERGQCARNSSRTPRVRAAGLGAPCGLRSFSRAPPRSGRGRDAAEAARDAGGPTHLLVAVRARVSGVRCWRIGFVQR
jgi:hypothetical protein